MTTRDGAARVNRLVTFAHVADVEASLAFYALLGFAPQRVLRDGAGRACWALAASTDGAGTAEIMFALADGPIDPGAQAVLFYAYCPDVRAMRAQLLAGGVRDGTAPAGGSVADGRRVAFDIAHPPHMPAGELRLHDPDGYVVLVGQLT